jgi:hypothetical protein
VFHKVIALCSGGDGVKNHYIGMFIFGLTQHFLNAALIILPQKIRSDMNDLNRGGGDHKMHGSRLMPCIES